MKEPLKINSHGNEAGLWYYPGDGCPKERLCLEEDSIDAQEPYNRTEELFYRIFTLWRDELESSSLLFPKI